MKAYWRVEIQLHAFFDLCTRWRWVVSFRVKQKYLQKGLNNWYFFSHWLPWYCMNLGRYIGHSRENECPFIHLRGCIQKFLDCPPGARTANGTALCHEVQSYRYFVSQSSEFCRHNNLCCFSTRVCCCWWWWCCFFIDSVWKLLNKPSYTFVN